MKNLAGTVALTLSVATLIVAGCAKSGPPVVAASAVAAGKAVFDANGCGGCHGGGSAPSLNKAGEEHGKDWLIAHVKNPKRDTPDSPMPAYEGRISEKDLAALGDYLSSLH
jgi:mono/diheme cytochrome c family protein